MAFPRDFILQFAFPSADNDVPGGPCFPDLFVFWGIRGWTENKSGGFGPDWERSAEKARSHGAPEVLPRSAHQDH
jgi:hypothetical protein